MAKPRKGDELSLSHKRDDEALHDTILKTRDGQREQARIAVARAMEEQGLTPQEAEEVYGLRPGQPLR